MNNKLFFVILILLGCNLILVAQYTNASAEQHGWRLASQAYTFNRFTFVEAIDKIKYAGINNIEMYPNQNIGGGLEGKTTFLMAKVTRNKLLAIINSKNMKLISYGVVSPQSKEEWIQLLDFAKEMGIETIITEVDSLQLNYIEPLAEKYQIRIALHNHPNPSIYWSPEFTMRQLAKRNKYIGVCTDLGHWLRSGLNPLECLRKYEGRILTVHAKDLVPGEGGLKGFHDVPWGTGISDFSGLMHELKRQGYKGPISVEYEYHWDNSLDEVKESVDYFNRLTTWMSKETISNQ